MFNMPKKAICPYIHHQVLKYTLETQIKAYAVVTKVQQDEKHVLQCFHYQLLKPALETQIMAYAASANVQPAEKRVFALFLLSTLEIYSRNANKGICS